jgi:hypothetical protein
MDIRREEYVEFIVEQVLTKGDFLVMELNWWDSFVGFVVCLGVWVDS